MKLAYILVIWSLLPIEVAQAEIFKRVDANGHVTYSSEPIKGSKKLQLQPLPTIPPPSRSRDSAESANFPHVDTATQKSRDDTSRQILEDELATEEKLLAEARAKLKEASEKPELMTGKDGKPVLNIAKQDEKLRALQKQLQMHEKNIIALKTELSNRGK